MSTEMEWRRLRGERLRALRKKQGLTQVELGKILGAKSPSATVSFLELGQQSMTVEHIEKLAKTLGTSPLRFLAVDLTDDDLDLLDLFIQAIRNPALKETLRMLLEANKVGR